MDLVAALTLRLPPTLDWRNGHPTAALPISSSGTSLAQVLASEHGKPQTLGWASFVAWIAVRLGPCRGNMGVDLQVRGHMKHSTVPLHCPVNGVRCYSLCA